LVQRMVSDWTKWRRLSARVGAGSLPNTIEPPEPRTPGAAPCPAEERASTWPRPQERPQDPLMDGAGWTFTTHEHGGDEPDTMPQAIEGKGRTPTGGWVYLAAQLWRPMAMAPRDRVFLAHDKVDGSRFLCAWHPEIADWVVCESDAQMDFAYDDKGDPRRATPTHWREVEPPPATAMPMGFVHTG
jgi:hypothetical protein